MLTLEDLNQLEPGDVVEALPLIPGLSDERVTLTYTETNDLGDWVFVAQYHGINLGKFVCYEVSGLLEWIAT